MHPLFTIDHIVDEICSYIPRSQLPVLARVSSTWFRYAISHLYKNPSIYGALTPLGGIILEKYNLKFTDMYTPSDQVFERFSKYARYVRVLRMGTPDTSIALEAIRMSSSKGIPFLFPNTRSFQWHYPHYSPECIEILIGFLSPKIDRLSFYIDDHRVLSYVCSLLMTRLSALCSVCIWHMQAAVEPSLLVKPVQGLFTLFTRTLTTVQISSPLNTPTIIECLSKMLNLCNLTIGDRATEELKRSGACRDKDSFPSLRSFSFDGFPHSFHDVFINTYGLGSLTVLSLNSKIAPDDVGVLISFAVVACPHIQSLSLGPQNVPILPTNPWSVVPWHSIQPISRCKELSSLSLTYMHISVSLEELTEFIKSRTTWTRLHILTLDPLRPQDMLLYAKHCPLLERLGIRLDGPVEFCVENLPSDFPTFSTLNTIDLGGCSHTTECSLLAEFLYHICNKRFFEIRGNIGLSQDGSILDSLANLYIDEERKTGRPIPSEIKNAMEFKAMMNDDQYFEYTDSQDEDDDDDDDDENDVGEEHIDENDVGDGGSFNGESEEEHA